MLRVTAKHRLMCGDSADRVALAQLMTGIGEAQALVSDPPYGLTSGPNAKGGFMGKAWDRAVPPRALWTEWLQYLAPGAHLLVFGGTRTYHRMVVELEDAGTEIRDQMQWLYGSGFPKSHDVSKAIDKEAGAERARKPVQTRANPSNSIHASGFGAPEWSPQVDEPSTPAPQEWEGLRHSSKAEQ